MRAWLQPSEHALKRGASIHSLKWGGGHFQPSASASSQFCCFDAFVLPTQLLCFFDLYISSRFLIKSFSFGPSGILILPLLVGLINSSNDSRSKLRSSGLPFPCYITTHIFLHIDRPFSWHSSNASMLAEKGGAVATTKSLRNLPLNFLSGLP